MPSLINILTLGATVANIATAFYLPGIAPYSYEEGEQIELKVNKLSSYHTLVPYDYYSLKFCKPAEGIQRVSENLGEFLRGDRIENSAYYVNMLETKHCQLLCQVSLNAKDVSLFKKVIASDYHHNWIMDNLPAASIIEDEDVEITKYVGYPVGFVKDRVSYLNNHVNIVIQYHTVQEGAHRIVGFKVEPASVEHDSTSWDGKSPQPTLSTCNIGKHLVPREVKRNQKVEVGKITYSYGVEFESSEVLWASRWDVYLTMDDAVSDNVHWYSISNSIMAVLFLSFMVAMIMTRTIYHDIKKYNQLATEEEKEDEREESGWKLVHADVFRPPTFSPMLFSVFAGTGIQIAVCALFLIIFAAVGFLSPANRGSIMIAMVLLFVLLGSLSGYVSSRLYKTFKGKEWQKCTVLTALLFPGIVFVVFFIFNTMLWSLGSTGAVPFLSMVAMLTLWFGISVPLVFLGAYFGYKVDAIEFPVMTSNIPRQIPQTKWFLSPGIMVVLSGLLPFGACFMELFFIMSSIWMDQYYYVFGFLLVVFLILCLTCAEVGIVLCYIQLCCEDYRWWWRSFLCSGSTAFYVFLYSIVYFTRLESNLPITYALYFGYMSLISLGLFLTLGSIGFFSCLGFTLACYGSIKVE